MKNILLLCLLVPLFAGAQKKSKKNTPATVSEASGFVINGEIVGMEDGATVDLLNSNTGAPELSTTFKDGKFTIQGKVEVPDFKSLIFNKKPPYINIFLDNSNITLRGIKDQPENIMLTGSPANDQFQAYSRIVKPYDDVVAAKAPIDQALAINTFQLLEKFVTKNPDSYVSPLAIYKIHQMTNDGEQLIKLFATLNTNVQQGPIGSYLAQQIAEIQSNPMGKEMADFSQPDPDGNLVSLKSLRGKYVLVDFWASWCGPCRGENPNVLAAYNRYKNKNFTVLGISLDREKQKWLDAIAADGLTWTHISDLQGWQNSVAKQFGINSIPQNFLVDPSGKVIGKNLRGEALEAKLSSILK